MDEQSSDDILSNNETTVDSALQRMKSLSARVKSMRQKLKNMPNSPPGRKKKAPLGIPKRALLGTNKKAPLGTKKKALLRQTKEAAPLGKSKMADSADETRQGYSDTNEPRPGPSRSDDETTPQNSYKAPHTSPSDTLFGETHEDSDDLSSQESQLDYDTVGTAPPSISGGVKQYLDDLETNTVEELEDDDDDWFAQWSEQFAEVEDTGPPLPEQLASLVSGMVKNKMTTEKEQSLMADVKTPSNATMLGNPRVNPDIWSNIGTHVRRQDLRLASVGERLSKMLVTTSKLTADLAELRTQVPKQNRDAIRELSKTALQGIQFGAMALRELNQRRRESIRPALNQEYQNICNKPDEETETLFGTDVADQMKSLQHVQSIGQKVSRGAFLGRGRAKTYLARNMKRGSHYAANYRSTPYQRPQSMSSYRGRGSRGHKRGWNN